MLISFKGKKFLDCTHSENSLRPNWLVQKQIRKLEMLLGHKIGLASANYRPTFEEMYKEYSKAIDNLTIDPANRLQRKIETLTVEKSRLDRIKVKMKKIELMYQK
jgi:hypothetical protein